jgi:hypothetical protein
MTGALGVAVAAASKSATAVPRDTVRAMAEGVLYRSASTKAAGTGRTFQDQKRMELRRICRIFQPYGTHEQRNAFGEEAMLHTVIRRSFTAVGLAAILTAPIAWAQDSPPVRVRGAIERVEGPTFVIKARDGTELKVALADNALIVAIVKASLSDIKPGSFVGVTGMPQPDGTQRAVEVHIFPESMRGTGEGHYPWDLQPQSTMTNANVEQVVTGVDGQTLTVKYKDGEKKIIVPPGIPIVTYMPGDKSELKPGVKIFIAAARKQSDMTLLAPRINYGRDGLTPPM